MTSIPKCRCGVESANREISRGQNRGRWYWKCAKDICSFFKITAPGQATYTFSTYTIPTRPKNHPFIISSIPSKQCRRTELDLGNTSLSAVGSGNDKSSRSRRKTDRILLQLSLYTSTDICVHAQGRHTYLQTIFNSIPGIAWLEGQQLWVFSADQQTYEQVWEVLQQHRTHFEVIGIPGVILGWLPKSTQLLQQQLLQNQPSHHIENNDNLDDLLDDMNLDFDVNVDADYNNSNNNNGGNNTCHDDTHQSAIKDSKMDSKHNLEKSIGGSTLWQEMTSEQQSGLKKIMGIDGHVYLQDPGGSGSSLQALGVALLHRDDWPVLIVCRASVCQKWNALIQNMLLLEQHQISLLDHISSDSPQSPQSPQSHRRQKREKLKKQKEKVAGVCVSNLDRTSWETLDDDKIPMVHKENATTANQDRKKGDIWIRILDNSGDALPSSKHNRCPVMDHVMHTKKQGPTTKKRKLQKGDIYIRMVDNSGDYYSDMDEIDSDDDDFMDSNDDGTSDRIIKIDTEANIKLPTNSSLIRTEQSSNNRKNPQQNNQATPGAAHFLITSYEKTITKLGTLSAKEYKVIIFDDCQDLNGTLLPAHKSSLQDLVNASKKTIMVSDIPILPKPMDSFALLQVLKPAMFVDKRFFGHRYCGAKHVVFGWDYTGSSNTFELGYLLNKIVLVS